MYQPTSVIAIAVLLSSVGAAPAQVNEVREPSVGVRLAINGQAVDAQLGEEVDVLVDGRNARISVELGQERELCLEHLRFRYPSYFKYEVHFEHETILPVRWDLKGHSVDVTVFRGSQKSILDPGKSDNLNAWMTSLLGCDVVAEAATQLEVGTTKLHGVRYKLPLHVGALQTELIFDAFEVPGDFGDVRYFLLLSDWNGENATEESLVRELLRTTFRLTGGSGGDPSPQKDPAEPCKTSE